MTELVDRKLRAGKDILHIPDEALREEPAEETEEQQSSSDRVPDLFEVIRGNLAGAAQRDEKPASSAHSKSQSKSHSKPHSKSSTNSANELRELTRDELYDRARELDLPGRSRMTKQELVTALRSVRR